MGCPGTSGGRNAAAAADCQISSRVCAHACACVCVKG